VVEVELDTAGRRGLRQAGDGGLEVADAQGDVLDGAAVAGPFGVEERELAELGVHADQREAVGLLDDVHAEVIAQEGGHRLTLVDPQGHVVEAARADG
jgi:hypothetical protein